MDALLSTVTTPVLGWIAQLMGWVMNGVYTLLDTLGAPNIGLSIIIYTIIIYMCMLPITIKQQKFQRLMRYIQPEISAIQKKYKGKRDQASLAKMQDEQRNVYAKYGTSQFGSCLPLIIQLPLIYALYQVIYHIPGYISRVADVFSGLATKIYSIPGGTTAFCNFISENSIRVSVKTVLTKTNVIDALSLLTRKQWADLAQVPAFADISGSINQVAAKSNEINAFLGLNITESPMEIIRNNATAGGAWWLVILAVLVPVLAWFTQWINFKLMPQQNTEDNPMGAGSMTAMNNFFPIFSAILCLSFQVGIGIYWITGAVIRCVQMIVINRKMMKVDMEKEIEKNLEKAKKKINKKNKDYVNETRVQQQARQKARNVAEPKAITDIEAEQHYENIQNADPDSLFGKANLVSRFEEKNAKGKTKIEKVKPISDIVNIEEKAKAKEKAEKKAKKQNKSNKKK